MDDFSFSRDPFAAARSIPAVDGVGFMHNRLDRDTEHRDETSIPVMLADSAAGFYLFHKDTLVVEAGATKSDAIRAIFDKGAAEALGTDMETVIILGTDPEEGNAPRLAALISDAAAQKLEGSERYRLESVRTLGLHGLLPADQLGAIAQARGLLNWHESHPYCSKCGTKTVVTLGGARRDCPNCSAIHFPRTDPAVIMLVLHRDETGTERCLLAHHTRFTGPMYTTLAGFMEQGETIENAVRREVFEEAAIRIGAVRYMASQPWPFPSSLMLGCYAEALTNEITIDTTELTAAQWFTRGEVKELMARGTDSELPHTPGPFSIAAWLIRSWVNSREA
ncbi:NAD(+) diphosphatase [Cohaesibacter haloalkalitolerans]|uniref:NAD(+) diphosphatase n=1 Tax=Cohaesibacter haloalkalitolerans TaxID=1162980 RepID=UPI000E6575FB|nr:NAD(+) diphosphatase [Cohaesibacter haloalkalitolerans]